MGTLLTNIRRRMVRGGRLCRRLLACLPAFLLLTEAGVAGAAATPATPYRLRQTQRGKHRSQALQHSLWQKAMQSAILDIHRHGAGGYSTEDAAHEALHAAFAWNERSQRLAFNSAGARPSFCSGAVYSVLLSALIRWDAAQSQRSLSPEAWKALAPQRVPDGVGCWGWANANGPGFALLAYRLGAGVSFTDWAQARPFDVAKLWWNDSIGGSERGHLVIFLQDEGENVRVWSSNQPTGGAADGYGPKTYPKSAIKRVLFTRIVNPAAFNRAPSIRENSWLMDLTKKNVSWEDCLRRCGVKR